MIVNMLLSFGIIMLGIGGIYNASAIKLLRERIEKLERRK